MAELETQVNSHETNQEFSHEATLFAEPIFHVGNMQITNSSTGQISQSQGITFGYYSDLGFKISIFTAQDSALSMRMGLNMQGGMSKNLDNIYYYFYKRTIFPLHHLKIHLLKRRNHRLINYYL